jgi:hypothetical protein
MASVYEAIVRVKRDLPPTRVRDCLPIGIPKRSRRSSNSTCPAVRLSLAAEKGSVPSETFNVMERRLLRGIINPGDDCGERSSSNPLDFSDTRPMERRDESSEETSLQWTAAEPCRTMGKI